VELGGGGVYRGLGQCPRSAYGGDCFAAAIASSGQQAPAGDPAWDGPGPARAIRAAMDGPETGLISTGFPMPESARGLLAVLGREPLPGLPAAPACWSGALAAHRRPQPRFDAVDALVDARPAAQALAVAGADSQ